MAKLHELLAVDGDLSSVLEKVIGEAVVTFAKKPDTFRGQTRTVTMFDEARSGENDTDTKAVNYTVGEKLDYVGRAAERSYDALFQKELTNQSAQADLIVDGEVLVRDVPATFLLGLETRLKKLRTVFENIPTLDPSLKWDEDPSTGEGVYVSQTKTSLKTEKTVQHKVLYDATPEHPAKIEKWNEDTPVGRIETIQRSGMLSVRRKSQLLGRVDQLIMAVKKARQRANTVDVVDRKIGQDLMNFVLAD